MGLWRVVMLSAWGGGCRASGGGAAAHERAVVATAMVVADEPGVGFGLELADGPEAAPVERRAPAFLQGRALEPFAHGVVVRAAGRDAVVVQAELCEVAPEAGGDVLRSVVVEHGPDRPAEVPEPSLHLRDEAAGVLGGDRAQDDLDHRPACRGVDSGELVHLA